MKWPETLTLIRHDESAYNASAKTQKEDPIFQRFVQEYARNPESSTTQELALILKAAVTAALKFGDHNTPLAEGAGHQARTMASNLRDIIELPDVALLSPYDRTRLTFEEMVKGWPELAQVPQVAEARLREKGHGIKVLYGDKRVMFALHPDQRRLYELDGEQWYQYPQGESNDMVQERGRNILGLLTREYSGKHVIAVTHHMTILGIHSDLYRLSPQEFADLDKNDKPINAGVTIYKSVPGGRDGHLRLDVDPQTGRERFNLKLY